MIKKYSLVLLLILPAILFSQVKKAITHEAMWLMKRIGAPEISANGKWVVFSVSEAAYDEKDQYSDLWLAEVNGNSKPRKITNTKAPETAYTWSPDNKTIAFVAKREGDEVAQIYSINIEAGGEAQRITNISTGAAAPQWSPDGSMLLFTSKVYPGAFTDSANKRIAEEKKKIRYKARVYNSFPIRDWDQWIDEKQTHLFVQKADSNAGAKDLFMSADLVNQEGFKLTGNSCWTSNSQQVIFIATAEFNASAYKDVAANLYSISLSGGNAVQISKDGFNYYAVNRSNDGKYLYCLASAVANYKVYNLAKLLRYNWPSMQERTLLANSLDRPINKFVLSGNKLILTVEAEGNDKIYAIAENEVEAKPFINNTVGCYSNTSGSSNNIIVANYASSAAPEEVVLINEGSHQNISDFNASTLALLDMPPLEIFWFTSSRGKKIKTILVRPAGFDPTKKYPLLVLMHGGPAGSWKDNFSYRWNYHLLAAPGYILLLTDYTGSTGYGEKFSQDIQYDPFKGPADEINEAASYATKKYAFINENLQAAAGGSYGGHLANWMQATTTHYKCLIAHAGLVNSESQWGTSDDIYNREVMNGGAPWMQTKSWKEQNPIRYAGKFKTPTLVTVGEQDFRVPLNNSIENFHALQRMKVPSRLIVFPEENHWILKADNSRFFYEEVQNWLNKYLK